MKYERSFVAYLDFLGFSEASRELNDADRQKVLGLLITLANLRSEFSAAITEKKEGSTSYSYRPAISTFSDHIVMSYGLETLRENTQMDDPEFAIVYQLSNLISTIAAAALRIGFLVRGAATVGKLYHAQGVVFGEALVEATQLEARTAVYPRIVLSNTAIPSVKFREIGIVKDVDGIFCLDYIRMMLFHSSQPGNEWGKNVKQWFDEIIPLVQARLELYERAGRLNELAKWTWFAKRFRAAINRFPPEALKDLNISAASIPWGQ
jgi:hypothetical protein